MYDFERGEKNKTITDYILVSDPLSCGDSYATN